MTTSLSLLVACLIASPGAVETRFAQVHPPAKAPRELQRSLGQARAVVLIHGLHVHPLHSMKVAQARFHSWQEPGSGLVKALSKEADVFALAYAQNAALETISQMPALADAVRALKRHGYEEIVLLGHSAGGVIARLFVEDHPGAGVTKVIQVCAPNGGTSWARAGFSVPKEQEPFLHSLTKAQRQKAADSRAGKTIPPETQFLCVVGTTTGTNGDGIVSRLAQWPEELQRQGIPAVLVSTTHFTVMRSSKVAERLAEFVRTPQPRWSERQRDVLQKQILSGGR